MPRDERNSLIAREKSPGDVTVRVRFRISALEQLVKGPGLEVHGRMQLVEEPDGPYAICIWSPEIPTWPDPVPGNAAAAAEIAEARNVE